ncbi:DinB family protein [Marinobacterium arenosum]|uniref:DinB family protein n=1 Tax=Marinobacterium arenosum TaxID=2862496 RepID=UPI001C95239F|nr:DinB family protein [Marinobacterium arenosum]MBY4678212.1 DinB family protein [Marinobacterium arenosum]
MSELHNLRLMARYNQWMNETLYDAAETLPAVTLKADQGAYFGSIMGTLNHLMVGDIIWLQRFTNHPANFQSLQPVQHMRQPVTLKQVLFEDIEELRAERELLDEVLIEWTNELRDEDLDVPLHYANMKGIESVRRFGSLALHLFNHQTHHRGQLTTLLSQQEIEIGITDLLTLIPELHD